MPEIEYVQPLAHPEFIKDSYRSYRVNGADWRLYVRFVLRTRTHGMPVDWQSWLLQLDKNMSQRPKLRRL